MGPGLTGCSFVGICRPPQHCTTRESFLCMAAVFQDANNNLTRLWKSEEPHPDRAHGMGDAHAHPAKAQTRDTASLYKDLLSQRKVKHWILCSDTPKYICKASS